MDLKDKRVKKIMMKWQHKILSINIIKILWFFISAKKL